MAVVEVELKFAMAEVASLKQENKELKEKVILMTDSLSKKDLEMLKRDQRISDLETQNKGQADLMDRQNEKILKLQQSEAAAAAAVTAAEDRCRVEAAARWDALHGQGFECRSCITHVTSQSAAGGR